MKFRTQAQVPPPVFAPVLLVANVFTRVIDRMKLAGLPVGHYAPLPRRQCGQITCYEERTDHVLTTLTIDRVLTNRRVTP